MSTWYSLPPRILQTLAWAPTRLLLNFFCHFEVKGKENLGGLTQAIFAVNHSNELDPIVLTAALSPLGRFAPMFYVGDPDEEFNHEKFGWRRFIYKRWFFRAWGSYPIFPGSKNYEKSLKNHDEILKDGGSLCIFPEGWITRDGKLQEAHGGVAFLSHFTGVTIVPVGLSGTFKLSPKLFLRGKRKISLHFGSPFSQNDLFGVVEPTIPEHYKSVAQIVMSGIARLLN
jgi:1-acyl-sn-glycerol-3-phosphate acyltransferase